VNIVVTVPNITEAGFKWPLHGQTLRIQALYTDTIQQLKEKVSNSLGGIFTVHIFYSYIKLLTLFRNAFKQTKIENRRLWIFKRFSFTSLL
jgi:hypothetical protein